jgi:outer membrane autotransporter protein
MNAIVHQMGQWLFDQPGEPNAPRSPSWLPVKAMPYQPQPQPWRLWAEGYGVGASVNGEFPLGTARLNYAGGGFAGGGDYRVDRDTLVGFAGGAGLSSFSVPDRATSGDVNGGHFAAYGAKRWGSFYASGIIGYDFFQNDEKRFAAVPGAGPVPGFAENLQGNFFSQSLSTRVELGWRTWFDRLAVTPFAALQFGLLGMNGYSETVNGGPSVIGLSYASRVVDSLPLFLGAQFDSKFEVGSMPAAWWLRPAWVHEFEPDRTINPSFLAAPGYDFIINGATAPRDAARLDAGLKLAITRNAAVFTSFNGEFSGKGNGYAGTGGLKISW